MAEAKQGSRVVYCHYSRAWIPMGRARTRCPNCGAVVGGEHEVRVVEVVSHG